MTRMRMAVAVCVAAGVAGAWAAGWLHMRTAQAQEGAGAALIDVSALYTKQDVMIPMRDGVKLHTEIYTPKNAEGPLPFLITRTPYGTGDDKNGYSGLFNIYQEMIPEGYIFVMQDIRGRYGSEGQFVMQRPARDKSDPKSIDEGTDTYDTIDWMLKNVPNNNGRAGLLGISYGGWLTAMALLEPHPALKAVSEQASPADMFLGDDFHHNGAFRLSYGFEYAAMMETGKTNFIFQFDKYDTYEWYLALGPLSNVDAKYLHGQLPTWEDFVNHPNYDSFWQKQAFYPYLKDMHLSVPDLNVAGWWDQEDFYGPVKIYETLEKNDTNHFNYLVVGPWNHGGWARSDGGASLGRIQFGTPTSKEFRADVQAPWFRYWLKDKGQVPFQKARTFETGTNKWVDYAAWPPKENVTEKKLYFGANGKLSFDAPEASGAEAFDSYVSDPAHPVPYRHRPIEETYGPGSHWYTWLVEDQRFADSRPDTVNWSTGPLDDDVCAAGDIVAHLYASTTGSDSDWIAKLVDVYPEKYEAEPSMGGYELMVANDVFRGRFRNSYEKPEPITPGKVTAYTIDLHTNDHCFLKGHRIMVQVQSTWFPIIDRNPQKFVPNIFKATASDHIKATQRIYRSKEYPSNVEVPVVQH
ncbi:MAG TPA: CocE/NonD family hydrolase [Candidatus Acidoferrales bacterium]|nr:CocE/NonD family hydrolase [Candidatus Acidoferrales bacterium]